jgi:hypothetical protein
MTTWFRHPPKTKPVTGEEEEEKDEPANHDETCKDHKKLICKNDDSLEKAEVEWIVTSQKEVRPGSQGDKRRTSGTAALPRQSNSAL